jgi:hypothetical protein
MEIKPKYLYYVIGVLILFCVYLGYVNYHKNIPASYDLGIYKDRIDSLNTESMRLKNDILFRDKLDSIRLKKLDSLSVENKRLFESREKLKKQITIYDTFKSVDINASADSMRAILSEVGFH